MPVDALGNPNPWAEYDAYLRANPKYAYKQKLKKMSRMERKNRFGGRPR